MNLFKKLLNLINPRDVETEAEVPRNEKPNRRTYNNLTELSFGTVRFNSLRFAIDTAINLTEWFRQKHLEDVYQDRFAPEALQFDVRTGKVELCNTDGDRFDPGYQAPELAKGDAKANLYTDRYLLGILIFMLLTGGTHPLEGRKSVAPVMTKELRERIYITEPSFLFSENNPENGPVEKLHYEAVFIWKLLPEFIKELFRRCFEKGIANPEDRPSETEWQEALLTCQNAMIACECGNVLYDLDETELICEKCGTDCRPRHRLEASEKRIHAVSGNRIYRCQISEKAEDKHNVTVIAKVVSSSKDLNKLGILNVSGEKWEATTTKGTEKIVAPGEVIPLKSGISFNVNGTKLSIVDNEK